MRQSPPLFTVISMLAILGLIAGCSPQTPSPQASTPQSASPTQQDMLAQASFASSDSFRDSLGNADVGGVNRAAQEIKNIMRQAMGVLDLLGDQAEAVFRLIDGAETSAVARMTEQVKSQSSGDLNLAPLTPAHGISMIRLPYRSPGSPAAQFASMGSFGLLVTAPGLFSDGTGNVPPMEYEEKIGENGTLHLTMHPKLNGSKLDVDLVMTINITQPIVYEERSTGKLQMDLCPDEQGNVTLNLSMKSGFSAMSGGAQWELNVQAVGHVTDEGFLSSIDFDSLSGFAIQNGTTNQFVEVKINYTLGGLGEGRGSPTVSNFHSEITRVSSQVTQTFVNTANKVFESTAMVFPYMAMLTAQDQWTKGYCVEIRVPDIPDDGKTVPPNSTTSFEATVWHKFDEENLAVPVIAILAGGEKSVQPAGEKVSAPASFSYTAPGEVGETATVHLETRSKRGIAEKDLTFTTVVPSLELHFDSLIVSDSLSPAGDSVIKTTQHVRAVVPLQWSEEQQVYTGEAALEYILFEVPPIFGYSGDGGYYEPCPNEVSASGGVFQVLKLQLLSAPNSSPSSPAPAPVIELTMDPGDTVESIVPVCPGPAEVPPGFSFPLLTWSEQFFSSHNEEMLAYDGPYLIKDWIAGSGDTYAIKTYTTNKSTFGILVIQENTSLTLVRK